MNDVTITLHLHYTLLLKRTRKTENEKQSPTPEQQFSSRVKIQQITYHSSPVSSVSLTTWLHIPNTAKLQNHSSTQELITCRRLKKYLAVGI